MISLSDMKILIDVKEDVSTQKEFVISRFFILTRNRLDDRNFMSSTVEGFTTSNLAKLF